MNRLISAVTILTTVAMSSALFGQIGAGDFQPQGLAIEASGSLVVVDHDSIVRLDPSTGARTLVAVLNDSVRASNIAVDASGDLFFVSTTGNFVARMDPVSGDAPPISGNGIGSGPPFTSLAGGVAVEPTGSIVVTNTSPTGSDGAVYRVDPDTGDRTIMSGPGVGSGPDLQGLYSSGAITVEPTGDLIVVGRYGNSAALYRVDPLTGDRTLLSHGGDGVGSGPVIGDNAGRVAVDASGDLVITGHTLSYQTAVFRVDKVTGGRTIISSTTIGVGFPFYGAQLQGIAVEVTGDLVVADPNAEAVFRVDAQTGDRTILSAGSKVTHPNDCSEAVVTITEGNWPFENFNTSTSSEPVSDLLCPGTGLDNFYNDVWFDYQPETSGLVRISVCDSDFNLAIYEGDCSTLTDLACGPGSCQLGVPQIEVEVVAGQSYKIRLGATDSFHQGVGNLTIRPIVPICQVQKVAASQGAAHERFGTGVAIDGDVALIGAMGSDTGQIGSAYVYRRTGSTWTEEQELAPIGGSSTNDRFGQSVAIDGQWAVVGAQLGDAQGADSGSVSVYRFNGSSWEDEIQLAPPSLAPGDQFGVRVAISGDVIVVGAWLDDVYGTDSGSAYVYRYDGTSWVYEASLAPSDSTANARFGISVGVSNGVIAVGAYQAQHDGAQTGAVYVYRRVGSLWVMEEKLVASDGLPGDDFGYAATIDGDFVLVGARRKNSLEGAAYMYQFDGWTWAGEQKLPNPMGGPGDTFGNAVGLSDGVAAVGSPYADQRGPDSGHTTLYTHDGTRWDVSDVLLPTDGTTGDQFGWVEIDISGGTVLVGAWLDDDLGSNSGSAYFFDFVPINPPSDLTSSAITSPFEGVSLSWLNHSVYDMVEIMLNGVVVETLAGDTTTAQISLPAPGAYEVCVRATTICGDEVADTCAPIQFNASFVRGDCGGGGSTNLPDAIALLGLLFSGNSVDCIDACDANGNGSVNLGDAVYLLGFLFSGASAPPAPFPSCGFADGLGCDSYTTCPLANDTAVLYRVNCGGPAVSDPTGSGPSWSADTFASPSPFVNALESNSYTAAVVGPITTDSTVPTSMPSDLFLTERWDAPAGEEMRWSFPVPSGTYELRLGFCETYLHASSRVFSVDVEGERVLEDFDQPAELGYGMATVMLFTVEVTDGTLDVDFSHVVENPAIKSIEVLSTSSIASP